MPEKNRVLLIDCVTWDSRYNPEDPLADVGGWFKHAWSGDPEMLEVHHATEDPLPDIENFLGVVVSGGPCSAYDDLPWIPRLEDLIRKAADNDVPFLGVCLGHQIAAQAMGGKVEKNPQGWEIGDPEVELTEAGCSDHFFAGLPQRFRVIQSHQDIVSDLPDGAKLLASSPLCEIQSFGLGENFRCVQFHPEMNPEILRFLLTPRRQMLLERTGVDIEELLPTLRETPESRSLFGNFARFFLGIETAQVDPV